VDDRNLNTLWAWVLKETLKRLGLRCAIVCPGSRSTPLTLAFAEDGDMETIPILDERSAAFFALGLAKRSGLPTVLICTSGTAAANFYPAIIEARESQIPLLVLTADRPAEMRDCRSGQTIDQVKMFGAYPVWTAELSAPVLDWQLLCYLRETMVRAWERSIYPVGGAVHINVPFRDPLPPLIQLEVGEFVAVNRARFTGFFDGLEGTIEEDVKKEPTETNISLPSVWKKDKARANRGVIAVGVAAPIEPEKFCRDIATLAEYTGFPVLTDALSPLRNFRQLNPFLITNYDAILRNPEFADRLLPETVIQIGDLPTSKTFREWLLAKEIPLWIVEPSERNCNSLHLRAKYIRHDITKIAASCQETGKSAPTDYCREWLRLDRLASQNLAAIFEKESLWCESKVSWILSQFLPPETNIFVANSMPVRDVEWFWQLNDSKYRFFVNRGANGIDGTLSTAMGIAHSSDRPSILLTGDLSLLHDTNGWLTSKYFRGSLTVILINNNGGGIFGMLPIAKFDPPFEEYFATPQNIDFGKLCLAYNIEHRQMRSMPELAEAISDLPANGIRVWEIVTDRRFDATWRQQTLRGMENGE
jgi:2-succinyl-5-enolpyruvyl-6-hydroxy-3-cyclohexene-1-carboxylate synthase